MYTLIRPFAALTLAILAFLAADAYAALLSPDVSPWHFRWILAAVAVVIGYVFLGGRLGREVGWAVFFTLQAIVLVAIATSMIFAVRMVFIWGMRRLYREPLEAAVGVFDHTFRYLSVALDPAFLLMLGTGGVVAGIVLSLLYRLLDRRRLAR